MYGIIPCMHTEGLTVTVVEPIDTKNMKFPRTHIICIRYISGAINRKASFN